jgi:transposase
MTIDVDTYTAIRRLYAMQKMSQREIATRLGISRTTVARYCEGERLPGERQNKTPKRTPLQEVVEPFILECLATNEEIARKKDRMNAKVIWRRLVEEKGVDIGQSTVRRLVAKLRHKTPEAFVPLSFEPGEAMQVDWGDVHAIINGVDTPVSLFCAVLPFSYSIFAAAFPNKSKESFFMGHILAFDFFGGVPRRCIYDNLRTAVAAGAGSKASKQESFSLFEAHYAFEAVFCNAAAGWEKGGVENLVSIARDAIFVPRPNAVSFQALQEITLTRCLVYREKHKVRDRKLSVAQAYAQEKEHLLPLPKTAFEAAKVAITKVGSDCTIRFGGTKYSVPWHYVGCQVTVRATPFTISIHYQGKPVAQHQRTYTPNDHQWNPDHYLELLERRPRARENASPLKYGQWPPELVRFRELYQGNSLNEDLVKLLRLARLIDPEPLLRAVELTNQSPVVSYDHVLYHVQEMGLPTSLAPDPVTVDPNDLGPYDQLLD